MHLPVNARVPRELPKHQRDFTAERYQSGEGCRGISKVWDIPWNTVETSSRGENMGLWHCQELYVTLKLQRKIGQGCQEAYSNVKAGISGKHLVERSKASYKAESPSTVKVRKNMPQNHMWKRNLKPMNTVKHAGVGIVIRGCFKSAGTRTLDEIGGNSEQVTTFRLYKKLNASDPEAIVQINQKKTEALGRPRQIPEPMEHLWGELNRAVHKRCLCRQTHLEGFYRHQDVDRVLHQEIQL